MTLKRLILVGLVALMVVPAGAEARSAFHLIGKGSAWGDGDRWAVLQLEGKPLRVIDEVKRRSWDIADTPDGCHFSAAAAGHVLWDCGSSPPRLQDVETEALRDVPGWDAYVAWFGTFPEPAQFPNGPRVDGFGSHWVRGLITCDRCGPGYSYIDWHTGRFVASVQEVATRLPDLDYPYLQRPLCAPLRRATSFDALAGDFAESEYERPWMLRDLYSPRFVSLYRCGHNKPQRVHRCTRGFCPRELGGGYLTWSETSLGGASTTVGAFRLADRRRLRVGTVATHGVIERTRRTVYLITSAQKVYAAPIPRR